MLREFDLLDLHNSEDTILRRCIRAYTISPKYVKNPTEKNFKAQKIVEILRKINTKLKKEIGTDWKYKWVEIIPYTVTRRTVDDWMVGKASMPLIAITTLNEFKCEKEVEEIKQHLDYLCSTTRTIARIPKKISKELAWFVATILCDGHMTKNGSRISFSLSDKQLINKLNMIFYNLFELNGCNFKIKDKPQCVKPQYGLNCENKAVVRFLNKFFDIPAGKKCDIITVPKIIQKSPLAIKKAFLKGVFDTDGGKRGGGLGLTSASIKFRDQNLELLNEFGIMPSKDEWVNKLYNKKYYGFRFKIEPISEFLCRGTEVDKRIRFRKITSHS